MKRLQRALLAAGAALAVGLSPLGAHSASAEPNAVAPEQLPDNRIGYVGFQRDTSEYREIPADQPMYPAACGPASVEAQYGHPSGHRGHEYDVTGYSAFDLTGPAGVAGVDVYAYPSAAEAAGQFTALRALHEQQCPFDHDDTAWEFYRESPITETGSMFAPASAFTVTAGNEALGSGTAATLAVRDNYIVAAGYATGASDPPVTSETTADIADAAARAGWEAVLDYTG